MELKRNVIDDIPQEIYDLLNEFGVPTHHEAYDYIAYASTILIDDPTRKLGISADVYPTVATAFNTTWTKVERAIRTTVSWIFDNTDPDILYQYFGNSISSETGKVRNSQLLYTLSRVARRKIMQAKSV